MHLTARIAFDPDVQMLPPPKRDLQPSGAQMG